MVIVSAEIIEKSMREGIVNDIAVIVIEMLVFAAIFTVVCFAATSGRNNIQIDNYPPEIQEEYFKTHDKPAPVESTRAAAVSTFCYYSTAADFETAAYADTACFVGAQVPPVASTVIPS